MRAKRGEGLEGWYRPRIPTRSRPHAAVAGKRDCVAINRTRPNTAFVTVYRHLMIAA